MAKKPEILEHQTEATNAAMPEGNGTLVTRTRPETKAPRKTKRATPTARKARSPKTKSAQPEVSDDAIRLRAYFISEERMRMSFPGDASSDWIEARRQLLAELDQADT